MADPTRKLEQKKLFTPGPVMVPDAVRSVARQPDIGHRRPQFESILTEVRGRILDLFRADESYTSVVVSGSGTAANETVINSMPEATFLFVTNGEFGTRLTHIAEKHGVDHAVLEYEWGETPDLAELDARLEDGDVDVVAMPYHETSTAMVNPVERVGRLCAERDVYFYADAISAVGGEDIHVRDEHIDVITGVANKAVASLTGCSFVCVRDAVLDELVGEANTVYLDLGKHVRYAEERSQTPNTPAVTSISALNVALYILLEEEGFDERLARYRRCSEVLRAGLDSIDGVSLLRPPADLEMANMLTSAFLPDGVDLDGFIDDLDQRGYLVYPGKGEFYDRGMFQVGNMGEIYESDCWAFLETVEDLLET